MYRRRFARREAHFLVCSRISLLPARKSMSACRFQALTSFYCSTTTAPSLRASHGSGTLTSGSISLFVIRRFWRLLNRHHYRAKPNQVKPRQDPSAHYTESLAGLRRRCPLFTMRVNLRVNGQCGFLCWVGLPFLIGCGGPDRLSDACEELGLTPGTPQFQRCYNAKLARQKSGERSAIDTVRSIDVLTPLPR